VASLSDRLKLEIRQLVEDEGFVLLEFTAGGAAGRLQLRALADKREGNISIDECARLSREVQHLIDEKHLLSEDYRLEFSSPGLEYPLKEEWQFTKNLGRLLKIQVPGEKGPKEINGRLNAVDAQGITVSSEKTEWKLDYKDLLSARVLPELKSPRMESKR
jgi:ribosome maturation factor RimP